MSYLLKFLLEWLSGVNVCLVITKERRKKKKNKKKHNKTKKLTLGNVRNFYENKYFSFWIVFVQISVCCRGKPSVGGMGIEKLQCSMKHTKHCPVFRAASLPPVAVTTDCITSHGISALCCSNSIDMHLHLWSNTKRCDFPALVLPDSLNQMKFLVPPS